MTKNQIDIKREFCNTTYINILQLKYRFRYMPYLVSDKFGNFFILAHCQNKRTSNFKRINTSKGYIYYQQNKIYLSTLRKRAILDEFTMVVSGTNL